MITTVNQQLGHFDVILYSWRDTEIQDLSTQSMDLNDLSATKVPLRTTQLTELVS